MSRHVTRMKTGAKCPFLSNENGHDLYLARLVLWSRNDKPSSTSSMRENRASWLFKSSVLNTRKCKGFCCCLEIYRIWTNTNNPEEKVRVSFRSPYQCLGRTCLGAFLCAISAQPTTPYRCLRKRDMHRLRCQKHSNVKSFIYLFVFFAHWHRAWPRASEVLLALNCAYRKVSYECPPPRNHPFCFGLNSIRNIKEISKHIDKHSSSHIFRRM